MSDYEQAALNLYPIDWFEREGFKIDNNAGLRKVAEKVFKHVFETLESEEVARGVHAAYERRRYGDEGADVAHMSTSLLFATIQIRDGDL